MSPALTLSTKNRTCLLALSSWLEILVNTLLWQGIPIILITFIILLVPPHVVT